MLRFIVPLSCLGVLLWTGNPLLAFAGNTIEKHSGTSAATALDKRIEYVPRGTEWFAGHDTQPGFRSGPAPLAFQKRYGGRWSSRRQAPSSLFWHIWGRGVAADGRVQDSATIANRHALLFWQNNRDLLPEDFDLSQLAPLANHTTGSRHIPTRYVSHQQLLDGIPVLGATLFVVYKNNRLVMLGSSCLPAKALSTQPKISAHRALRTAHNTLLDYGIQISSESAEPTQPALWVVPLFTNGQYSLQLAYQIKMRAPQGAWTAYIDAHDGSLVALRDERLFLTAALHLRHHNRTVNGGLTTGPGAHLRVNTSGGQINSDDSGQFTTSGSSTDIGVNLDGTYANVINLAGAGLTTQASGLQDGATHVWQGDGSEFQQSQLDAYRFVTEVRNYTKNLVSDVPWLDQQLDVSVNYNGSCNAWYDGNLTFMRAGVEQGMNCNNTAMIADIVYHEYGHGFHHGSTIPGVGTFDESVSEGLADYLAATINNDPELSPEFEVNQGPLRDLRPDKVWPTDQSVDPHETGLIVGGAMWDLRQVLVSQLGLQAGVGVADTIFAGLAKTVRDVPSLYEAALLADDDNGDLSDGTPHFCAIQQAFAGHGLADQNEAALTVLHTPPGNSEAIASPIPITARISVTNPECSGGSIGHVELVYSSNSGNSWNRLTMTPQGDTYTAQLPASSAGTQLQYRLEVEDTALGISITRPNNRAEPYYTLYIGRLRPIVCDNLESDDPAWVHQLLQGEASEGADDWQRGTPTGTGGDPDHAFSGDHVWGNDLALESSWNGLYQPSKTNTLRGPTWDLAGASNVRLQFRRWLTVEDGLYDKARVFVNEQQVWVNRAGAGDLHHIDREWIPVDIDISPQVAQNATALIRWELESDPGAEHGGWNIDDVCLYQEISAGVDAGPGPDAVSIRDATTSSDAGPPVDGAGGSADSAGLDTSSSGRDRVHTAADSASRRDARLTLTGNNGDGNHEVGCLCSAATLQQSAAMLLVLGLLGLFRSVRANKPHRS